jgi:hypothetical protein
MVVGAVLLLTNVWVVSNTQTKTFLFRPVPFLVSVPRVRNALFFMCICTGFISGVGGAASRGVQIGCLCAMILIYATQACLPFWEGGFVGTSSGAALLVITLTACALCLCHIVLIGAGATADLFVIFGAALLFVILVVVGRALIDRYIAAVVAHLNDIMNDQQQFDIIRRPERALSYGVVGFACAHPICLDWSYYRLTLAHWPNDTRLLYIFARFAAIFPEEVQVLREINALVSRRQAKDAAAGEIREQVMAISRQRHTHQSAKVESKLKALTKQQEPTKFKLRYVWDVVIQGNIGEVEGATNVALNAVEHNFADFLQLLCQFPNNRFVARKYAKFLKEWTTEYLLWRDACEKAEQLKRGMTVSLDEPHEYGMAAFPLLPERARPKRDPVNAGDPSQTETQGETGREIDITDETREDLDQILTLRHRIDELSIPAISGIRKLRFVMVIIMFFAPTIFAVVYLNSYMTDLLGPLEFLSKLSLLNVYATQIVAFAIRYLGESFDLFPLQGKWWADESPPVRLGGTWETRLQLRTILATAADAIEDAASFRAFPGCEQAKASFFRSTFDYQFYIDPETMTVNARSLQSAFVEFIVQVEGVVQENQTLTDSIVNTSGVLNTVANLRTIEDDLAVVRTLLFGDITEANDKIMNVAVIVLACGLAFIQIVVLIGLVIEVSWAKSNKEEAYRALVSIPKRAVSAYVDSLRVQRRTTEGQNSFVELDPQEESILKTFSTVGSSDAGVWDMGVTICGTLLIMICTDVILCLIYFFLKGSTSSIGESAPHAYYICDAYSSNLLGLFGVDMTIMGNTTWRIQVPQTYSNYIEIQQRFAKGRLSYEKLSFGDQGVSPFASLYQFIDKTMTSRDCQNRQIPTRATTIAALYCYPPDILFALIEPIVNAELLALHDNVQSRIHSDTMRNDIIFGFLWHTMISPLYDDFFSPMYETVLPETFASLSSQEQEMRIPIIVLLVVEVIVEVLVWASLARIAEHIRAVLRMMLAIPAQTLLTTPKIMKVLSGDFTVHRSESLNRDTEFFESAFMELPVPALYANGEMIIQAANTACVELFLGKELARRNLHDFFRDRDVIGMESVKFDQSKELCVLGSFRPTGQPEVRLAFHIIVEHNFIGVIMHNSKALNEYEDQIRHERETMEQLLARVLPAPLLRRIQQEGSNRVTGFAVVQISSIIFLNFVHFAPWAASVGAAVALGCLNQLVAKFDGILQGKPAMTKIKTMGDVYMSAGGIFSEVNQQHEHATEALHFGLEAIREVRKFN